MFSKHDINVYVAKKNTEYEYAVGICFVNLTRLPIDLSQRCLGCMAG